MQLVLRTVIVLYDIREQLPRTLLYINAVYLFKGLVIAIMVLHLWYERF